MVSVGPLWEAQQALGYIMAAPMTQSTNHSWYDVFTAATRVNYTGRISNLAISGGTRDVKPINTFGVNQLKKHDRVEIIQAEFSIVYQKSDSALYLAGPALNTFTSTIVTGASTFTEFQYGEQPTIAKNRSDGAVAFCMDNGDVTTSTGKQIAYVVMNNATCVSRELSLNSEGYVEEKFVFKCLARDYFEGDNFTGVYN